MSWPWMVDSKGMVLWMSSGLREVGDGGSGVSVPGIKVLDEHSVDLTRDVSLEAAQNVLLRQPFLGASWDVGAGAPPHTRQRDGVQRVVRAPSAAPIAAQGAREEIPAAWTGSAWSAGAQLA